MFYNFTQVEGTKWRLMMLPSPGPSFNAAASSKDLAIDMFLEWMWGGKDRPDRMSFEEFKMRQNFTFI